MEGEASNALGRLQRVLKYIMYGFTLIIELSV